MKKTFLLFALIGIMANAQIKIENNSFTWKDTTFKVEQIKNKPDLVLVYCFSVFKGKKESYIFELDGNMNVVRFFYNGKWYNQ